MPTIHAALADRLLVASGPDWTTTAALSGRSLECVAATDGTVLVGTFESGLWRETGDGFEQSWPTDAPQAVTSVAVSPVDGRCWAGTEPSAVYRSTDAGQSWARCGDLTALPSSSRWSFPPRPHTHHVRWLEPDPADPETLYVGIENGAFLRTSDGGETWQDHPDGARRDNHQLATHVDAPGRVYTAAGDGYAESLDGGDAWTYPQDGLAHRYVWSLAVDPADPDHVLVVAASGAHQAHRSDGESYVYRTDGDGWTVAMDGLPGPDGVARPILDTGPDGAFYALSNHGLFRSEDGVTWQNLGVEWREAWREQVPRGLRVV